MDRYEINETTQAVVACNEEISKIYEENATFYIQCNSNKIIEDSCEFFGSSLDGRIKGTKALIGIHYKPPIIIEESRNIIFFPITSIRNKENSWISLYHIDEYYQRGNKVVLRLKNGKSLLLDISLGSFENQILRSTRLESTLRGRKRGKKRFIMR